jgi:signal transduction histidine kinase
MRKPPPGVARARDPGPGRVQVSRQMVYALAAASAAIALGLVPLLATSDFVTDRAFWIVLDVAIGAGFTGVGLFAWYRRPDNPVGRLMVATAFAWYFVIAGYTESAFLWTLGQSFSNLFVATAIHLLLAFPSGRLESALDRAVVGIAYAATTVLWLPFVLFTSPVDLGCADCPDNLLLIDPDAGFTDAYLDGLGVLGITLMITVLARLIQRWRGASAPLRRAVTPVFLAGGALMLALAGLLGVGLFEPFGDNATMDLFYACAVAFGLVPYLFLAGLVRGRWIRGRGLGALIRWLGQPHQANELPVELGRALGDPSVELAYWLPDPGQYVDAEGRPVELPPPVADRAVTAVDRDGRRIAAIVHDPALLDDPEQVRAAGAAAALALENARLEAELRAKVEEIRASRERIVAAGYEERRRLERNLHDGAQQRFVSLALNLRLARSRLDVDPAGAARLLESARRELQLGLGELRELARGIHPAILTDRGLDAALAFLAARAPFEVTVEAVPAERLPERVEAAAYFVVSEALTNAVKHARATSASVRVAPDDGRLTVEVADNGVGGADPAKGSGLRGLRDRLSALDGRLEVDSRPGQGTTLRASIPCG